MSAHRSGFAVDLIVLAVGLTFGLIEAGCDGGGHNHRPTATPTGAIGTATATATGGATTPTPTATAGFTATVDPNCPVGPVSTSVGDVCGKGTTVGAMSVRVFLGIPFAEDTGGANRWQPPIPKARATGRIQATEFGPICPQDPETGGLPPQSEDCLSINVWTPSGAAAGADLPVMVFIYGGSFDKGASAVPLYDGSYISATQNVVVVTFNYRVGALGFLAGVDGLAGNYGLRDQQLALQWVADNVQAFGGDPAQVMLFGESAGAMSVGLHLLSIPSSEGLFVSALMESNPFGLPYKTQAEATEFGTCFQAVLGCEAGGLDCMRGKSAADIVDAQSNPLLVVSALFKGLPGFVLWAPSIDGTLVTQQPIAGLGAGLPKPTLLGTNKNEGTLFVYSALQALGLTTLPAEAYHDILVVLFGEANTASIEQVYPPVSGDNAPVLDQVTTDYLFFCANRHVAAAGVSPVYAYEFTQLSNFNIWPNVPECAEQVCHAAELPYVFHSASNIGATFTPAEDMLSQTMVAYWAAFSREGADPNNGGPSRPQWPAFAGFNYLILGTPISTAVDPPHNCSLWDQIGYEVLTFSSLLTTDVPCL